MMKERNRVILQAIGSMVVAGGLALGAAMPASAESVTSPGGADSAKSEIVAFVDSLGMAPEAERAIEEKLNTLSAAEQAAIAEDPMSAITFGDMSAVESSQETTRLLATTYRLTNNQPVQFLGITFGTFYLSYTYQANSTSVTQNLECTGWWNGAFLSGSSSPSSYISNGRGTCTVRHQMSALIQGSPVQFTKVHTITTDAGNPTSGHGSISNG